MKIEHIIIYTYFTYPSSGINNSNADLNFGRFPQGMSLAGMFMAYRMQNHILRMKKGYQTSFQPILKDVEK